ncbi:hypothetical protein M422DRAFT_59846 [Sphaerobolus stellatus SS14]|uniref:Exoribonuclease phosphorolytic domain-containing protein n=1 Tax=Sphaerobolus stellatus (strain SS14) TaxID=990650 RepID=A0A0C9W3G2_SPHS4|nr:hypothetical protein M422DRAFT_59846 [Sphaerobolus stellatus SS14]
MATTFDRRRINGPEESRPPIFEEDEESTKVSTKTRQGRNPKDIRPIFLTTGLINQANGSAYVETAKTKIACAVYGPRQIKNAPYNDTGKLNVEVKFAPFSCKTRRAPLRDAEDRSISMLIQQSILPSLRLDLLPKSSIDIFITIIENDGIEGCVASGSTAASAALADAGIEMYGLVTACASGIMEDEVWFDPTAVEAAKMRGCLTLACMPAVGTVTNIWQTGQMSVQETVNCIAECQARCRDIHDVVAAALLNSQTAQSR